MSREKHIQEIIESSNRIKQLALSDQSKLGALQLSEAQLGLVYLLFFHQKMSVKQAAKHLSVSLSAISQLGDSLQADGYVARAHDPNDRRIVYMSLTPKGHKIVRSLKKSLTSGRRALMETLNDQDLASLNKIYKKMAENAEKQQQPNTKR